VRRGGAGGLACVCVALALVFAVGCGGSAPPPPPNVTLIVIDTLRPDHLGLHGYPRETSPHLDAFAAEAIVFDRWYANAPWTKPSVASLFTSLWPSQHRADQESSSSRLAGSLTTLAEILRAAGYATGGFSENPHVGAETGFAQGFDTFENRRRFRSDSRWVVREARQWLERRDGSRPFFLYLHFLDPHGPYADPDSADFVAGLQTRNPFVARGRVGPLVRDGKLVAAVTPGDALYLAALYDAEIRAIDRAVGDVFALLRENQSWDETLVAVTSDHGEEFLEHGLLKHGYHLYEEALRVPMLWRIPGTPGRRIEAPAQHVDFAPTLLARLGVDPPPDLQGRRLSEIAPAADSVGETPAQPVRAQSIWRGIHRSAVRDGRWKLIADLRSGRRELYDLDADPREERVVSADRPEQVARIEALLM